LLLPVIEETFMKRILLALGLLAAGLSSSRADVEVQALPGKYRFSYVAVLHHVDGQKSALNFISSDIFENFGDCQKGIRRSDQKFREGMLAYRKMPLTGIDAYAACHLLGQPDNGFDMLFPVK
jgi:hypothetical protein